MGKAKAVPRLHTKNGPSGRVRTEPTCSATSSEAYQLPLEECQDIVSRFNELKENTRYPEFGLFTNTGVTIELYPLFSSSSDLNGD